MTIPEQLKRKLFEALCVSAALGIAFLAINYLHFQFISVSVILYACLWDILLATLVVVGGYLFLRRDKAYLLKTEFGLTVLACNLFIVIYSIMGPTVIDRSLSLYIVNKIDQRGGEVKESAMPDIFVREYLPEFRLVDVRMTEQVTSGTVEIENGCVHLTARGKRLSRFVNWYRANFLPKRRVLMDEVTDQLTDPFRNSQAIVDTQCQ
ncbi:MAG: hypothetical protein AAGA30_13445 [Planctomycetota bacterium]